MRQTTAPEGSTAGGDFMCRERNAAWAAAFSPDLQGRFPMTKHIQPVPEDNCSDKGPGSAPKVTLDNTKGHRDDEKHNIREQAAHGNLTQNTSNRRSG
jgi:hypothetical protein